MARTRKGRWSYSSGERGRNRVRAFENPTGLLFLEFSTGGKRKRVSLGHRDPVKAKREADKAAAELAEAEELNPQPCQAQLTVGKLFEMYLGDVTPRNGERHQAYDRLAAAMFVRYLASSLRASALSRRDWDRFLRDRREGFIGPGKGPWRKVGARTVQKDLYFLQSVLRWATQVRGVDGNFLLDTNPLRGLKPPGEKNPRRVTMGQEDFEALLSVAREVDWRFWVALVLAHETGHRIGAIRKLSWSDIDFERRTVFWRAEHEKTGREHVTPLSQAAISALELARERSPGIGDAPVLPAPKDRSSPGSSDLFKAFWSKAERAAGLEHVLGGGWHSVRRKFATELSHLPEKTLCELGGWKDADTVRTCYQHPDEAVLRAALDSRNSSPRRSEPTPPTDTKHVVGWQETPRPRS